MADIGQTRSRRLGSLWPPGWKKSFSREARIAENTRENGLFSGRLKREYAGNRGFGFGAAALFVDGQQ
jgi:hypothetical protein